MNSSPDGRLRILADVDYPIGSYPMIRNLFVDFTTMAPFTNDDPVWSTTAPAEKVPSYQSEQRMEKCLQPKKRVCGLSTKAAGVAMRIFTDAGWDVRMDENAGLYVMANGASAVGQCAGVDAYGAKTVEHRNYTFGKVMDASAALSPSGDTIEFTPVSTGMVASLTVNAHALQTAKMGSSTTAVADTNGVMMELSMSGLSPGSVMIAGIASANGMLDYNFMLDLGIEKSNKPPSITIDTNLMGEEAEWELDGLKFTLNGNVIDPDGQDVNMMLHLQWSNI